MPDRKLSPESAKELAELKAKLHSRNAEALRCRPDGSFYVYPADNVDYHPEPEILDDRRLPEVRVFAQVAYTGTAKDDYDYDKTWTMQELVAYVAESILRPRYISPPAGELPHATVVEDNASAIFDRLH